MTRAEIYETLDETGKVLFVLGAMSYEDDTKKNTTAITREQAESYNALGLRSILYFLAHTDEFDFEVDTVALDTLIMCATVLAERRKAKEEVWGDTEDNKLDF